MSVSDQPLESLAVNTIRMLSIDAIDRANSGHPGLPMGAAPMAYVLWQRHLRHNPANPAWPDRDRFVLSGGHGSMLLYSLLHLSGYDIGIEDIQNFRQWGSRTPGHPEFGCTPGVEATTGPLGQGIANAVGMAIAERRLAAEFNRPGHTIVDHATYALCSDGDLMEGVAAEAASLAGHLRLGKLTVLFDSNDISLDGPTSLSFTEDVGRRFAAYGWQVLEVRDGDHDLAGIDQALAEARAATDRPSLILVRTTIGYGAPTKAGTSAVHGAPLDAAERAGARAAYGWPSDEPFHVPAGVAAHFAEAARRGAQAESDWNDRFNRYRAAHPELAAAWEDAIAGRLPAGWDGALPDFADDAAQETRTASGTALNALATGVPSLMGLDADLSSSTKAYIKGGGDFDGRTGAGRNLRCGVREHAMGSIANGIAYHGGLRPFTSTFFVFSDYMRPPVRLAAMSHLPVIYVWTHDSVAVGEDGPTHEPIEHLAALRAIPNLSVVRPADARETAAAWAFALERSTGPTALVLTRQKVPMLPSTATAARAGVAHGAYVVADASGSVVRALLIATGSEVSVALDARERLEADGIPTRVVSMPCWESFERQPVAYRDSVLPPEVLARVSVEAGSTFGWRQYLGAHGVAIGIDRFGASAPGPTNLEKFGFTGENVARVTQALVQVIESGG